MAGALCSVTRDVEATNYPLICNGMQSLVLTQLSSGPFLAGYFGAAPLPAGQATPPFGTCAWHDRVLRSTEPRCISVVNARPPTLQWGLEVPGHARAFCNDVNAPPFSVECALADSMTPEEVVSYSIGSGAPNNGNCFTATSVSFQN
jgi:hypothetical protein